MSKVLKVGGLLLLVTGTAALAQPASSPPRQFPPGSLSRPDQLPPGRMRTQIERLPAAARERAIAWLNRFHFTEGDLESLNVDAEGGVFYVDNFTIDTTKAETIPASVPKSLGPLPISPFPASLVFHSRPGAPNVIYLNFCGETVSGTQWSATPLYAVPMSTDADFTTFSDAEQTMIKRIWERVAEDYSPFNVDVTTERPASFGNRVAHALITRNTDSNGVANPSSTAGGVAYVSVFGGSGYSTTRPAWIYYNNLSGVESYIGEAVSHEIGHNLGLSHDGTTSASYYGGHGTGDTSWGPIMGTGYDRNVSQWSKGEYYQANNTQDDLNIIAGMISYRADDCGDTIATSKPLVITGGTNVVVTTPETDPTNTNSANKGVLQSNTDVDVFSFVTGTGPVSLAINPWIMPGGTRGGNLDVSVDLRNASGTVLLTNNPDTLTTASIQTNLPAGTYYIFVRNTGVGNPTSSTPTGYTAYGSIGQYFISGYVALTGSPPANVQLTTLVNKTGWGTVSPTGGVYSAGSTVQMSAAPAAYFSFQSWTGDAAGTNNPVSVVLSTNRFVEALFTEVLTTNYPTPRWWLASYGFTNNFETAVTNRGANGIPLWQSYIAGLNPNNPNDRLLLSINRSAILGDNIVNWNTVTGRVYTLQSTTNLLNGFTPVSGAVDLPSTTTAITNHGGATVNTILYRVEVRKP